MKKMKKQLQIEKTTISRLTNLNTIQGGETIGSLDCQDISRYPALCPPITQTCPPPTLTTTATYTMDC